MRFEDDGKTLSGIDDGDIIDGVLRIPGGVRRVKENLCRSRGDITDLIMPEGVTIGWGAFYACTGIRYLILSEGVVIEGEAFHGCTGISDLIIPEGITIRLGAFWDCTGITDISFSEGVTIKGWAFWNCTGIRNLTIHEGVTIVSTAFYGCNNIKSINIHAIEDSEEYEQILNSFPEGLRAKASSGALPPKAALR